MCVSGQCNDNLQRRVDWVCTHTYGTAAQRVVVHDTRFGQKHTYRAYILYTHIIHTHTSPARLMYPRPGCPHNLTISYFRSNISEASYHTFSGCIIPALVIPFDKSLYPLKLTEPHIPGTRRGGGGGRKEVTSRNNSPSYNTSREKKKHAHNEVTATPKPVCVCMYVCGHDDVDGLESVSTVSVALVDNGDGATGRTHSSTVLRRTPPPDHTLVT